MLYVEPNVAPVAERLVVEAFVAVNPVKNPLVKLSPDPDTPEVEALSRVTVPPRYDEPVNVALVADRLVVDALAIVPVPVIFNVVPVRDEINPLVKLRPLPVVAVVEAFVK